MKKIFAYVLALAAFASCSTDITDVNTTSATFTAPMEIEVCESRAFDSDLNWGWESSDIIAAYQNAGSKAVNELKLNENGNFYNAAFEYATEGVAAFHFVYPAAQLGADYSLTVAQTGAWTPVLYGTVEAATVANLGTVEMNYLSSAFELRFWESGRAARKNIVKATLTSESDFVPTWNVNGDLTYTQTLSGKELSLELNGDTAIFNLGEGDFIFNLTMVDAEGESLTYELPSKNFVAGKRTILNVEWRQPAPAVEGSIDSWYEDYANNGSSALEGGVIYVTAVGGEPVVTVNGETKQVVDGKVAVESGSHNVVVTINGQEVVNRSIVVTSIPTVSANIRSSYSNNGDVDTTNDIPGNELRVSGVALSDAYVASNLVKNNQHKFVYGGSTRTETFGNDSTLPVNWGAYNCYVAVELGNGYVCQTPTYTTHVTGVPYHADWRSADYSDWKYTNISDKGNNLQVTNSKLGCIISPAFHTPNGSLAVKAAIAASTNATSTGGYTTSYVYAGTQSSSAKESGAKASLRYLSDFGGSDSDAPLQTADASINLTSSNPCVVFTAKDFIIACNTYVFQAYICY